MAMSAHKLTPTFVSVVTSGLILAAGLLVSPGTSSAKPEYTRRLKMTCEYCHPPDSRALYPTGEYFRDHHYKMDGYQPSKKEQDRMAQMKLPWPYGK